MKENISSLISFCVNTSKNELPHLKLLFRSFQKNLSTLDHEFIVYIDSDNQNTFDWLLEQKSTFPKLKIIRNEGIPYANSTGQNILFEAASNDIVSYLHSDMVICKNYDLEILKDLKEDMLLCSTRVEPPLHGNSGEKLTYDFSTNPLDFDLDKFTSFAELQKVNRITEYFFAPYTMYKKVWLDIGGHDIQFRRSREDSDIYMRLLVDGIKVVQTWRALVYHFTCTSSRGVDWFDSSNQEAQSRVRLQNVADQFELNKLMRKWGKFNHSSTQSKYYNVSAIVEGSSNSTSNITVLKIEPFFSKMHFNDTTFIDVIQRYYNEDSQKPANQLMGITDTLWEEYSYLFQTEIIKDRLLPLPDQNSDIVVAFDINEISDYEINYFIYNLQDIIESTEDCGDYEFGPFRISINKKINNASNNVQVVNPQMKPEHVCRVY